MSSQEDLIRKLKSIERLFAGATTEGEKAAASNALERIMERLEEYKAIDPPVEYKFSLSNIWSRKLLSALLRRYGIQPYRYSRQRYTTVMAKVPEQFVDTILWPEFEKLNVVLIEHIEKIAENVISEAIFSDTSEAEVTKEQMKLL